MWNCKINMCLDIVVAPGWNCMFNIDKMFKVQKKNVRRKRISIVPSKRKSSAAHKRRVISRYSTSGTKEKREKYEREKQNWIWKTIRKEVKTIGEYSLEAGINQRDWYPLRRSISRPGRCVIVYAKKGRITINVVKVENFL